MQNNEDNPSLPSSEGREDDRVDDASWLNLPEHSWSDIEWRLERSLVGERERRYYDVSEANIAHEKVINALQEQVKQLTSEVRRLRLLNQEGAANERDADADLNTLREQLTQLRGELDAHIKLKSELYKERAGLQAELMECQKTLAITRLSIPIEEELSARIDDMLKHLATEQGFTLVGIARLLMTCQQRMAADWVEVGRLRRDLKGAQSELDRVKAEKEQAK